MEQANRWAAPFHGHVGGFDGQMTIVDRAALVPGRKDLARPQGQAKDTGFAFDHRT